MTRINPLVPILSGLATWLSLLPFNLLLAGHAHLIEAAILIGAMAFIGALSALLRLGRGTRFSLQLLVGLAVVLWRAHALSNISGIVEPVFALVQEGAAAIASTSPPLPTASGLAFVTLLVAFVVQLILVLIVEVLEQPGWAFAPLVLCFVVAGIASPADLSLWHLAAVTVPFVLLLAATTGIGEGHRTVAASKQKPFHVTRAIFATILALAAVAATLALQPLLPIADKQTWQHGQDGPIQLSDPTVTLNENLRRPNNQPMFSYTSSDGKAHYLRTVALPDLTNDGARLVAMQLRSGNELSNAYLAPGDQVSVKVQMRSVLSEYLPVPFAVDRFDAEGSWSYDPTTLAIVATGSNRMQQTIDLSYSATATVPNPSKEELDAAEAGTDVDPITTVVPEVSQAVRTLTEQVTKDATTAGEKAQAIQDFLRSNLFTYSLDAPQTASLDVISAFLLEDRSGYCIHYASAMITMARIEGIPSRMVIGFNGGVQQSDGSWLVTSHNMHAWPELYFDGLGWVSFEPTPSAGTPLEYTDPNLTPSTTSTPTPALSASPTSPRPTPDPTPSASLENQAPSEAASSPSAPGWVLGSLLAALLVALLLALPWSIRLAIMCWRLRSHQPPADLAANAWREVHAIFIDAELAWPESSPVPLARAVADQLAQPTLLIKVAQTIEQSTFAREGANLALLPADVRALRRSILRLSPWSARWLPRSLWHR